jgi:type IV secretory pathway component VirB8
MLPFRKKRHEDTEASDAVARVKGGFGRRRDESPADSSDDNSEMTASKPSGSSRTGGDEIGTYPREVDVVNNQHRRFHRNLRVEHIIIGCLLVVTLVQANVISQLFPLYRVVPFFVTFSDKDEQVVRIQPPTTNLRSMDVITEANVREYVKLRNTISQDDATNIARWGGKIENMSTREIYENFLNEIKPVFDAAKRGRFHRTIVLDSVAKVQDGYYRVDFTAYDRTIGSGLADTQEKTSAYSVEMRVAHQPRTVPYAERFLNPFGFTVTSYVVVPRRTASAN